MDGADKRLIFPLLFVLLFLIRPLATYVRRVQGRRPRRARAGSVPGTTPEERMAAKLAREIAEHGAVRPPWVYAPGHDPFSITWRMGDEDYHWLWASWAGGRSRSERAEVIRRYGAVPAEWARWAASAACDLSAAQREGTDDDDDGVSSIEYAPLEEVRALLAAVGIEVAGEAAGAERGAGGGRG